jgi:hypothetical protein
MDHIFGAQKDLTLTNTTPEFAIFRKDNLASKLKQSQTQHVVQAEQGARIRTIHRAWYMTIRSTPRGDSLALFPSAESLGSPEQQVHHLGLLSGRRVGVAPAAARRRLRHAAAGRGRELQLLRGVARQRAEGGELPLALAPGAHGYLARCTYARTACFWISCSSSNHCRWRLDEADRAGLYTVSSWRGKRAHLLLDKCSRAMGKVSGRGRTKRVNIVLCDRSSG